MRSVEHFKISVLTAPIVVYLIYGTANTGTFFSMTLLGISAGVLIDLDHFPVVRAKTGNWRHLKIALSNPLTTFTDEDENWGENMGGNLGAPEKFIYHTVITVLSLTIYPWYPRFSLLLFSMFSIHIASDLYRSWQLGNLNL